MFKYFSDILKNFTPAQRMIALSLLLLTVFLVSAGPSFIKSFRDDNKVLTEKVILQNRVITELNDDVSKLNKDIDTLNYILRTNQIECTNLVLKREKEIMVQITLLEQSMSNDMVISKMETVFENRKDSELSKDDYFLRKLQLIKKDLQKSIDKKKQ